MIGSGRAIIGLALAALVTSCSSFEEKHYFAKFDGNTGQPVNFYRLSIRGGGQFSAARYVAGYYDERAVDLFFNTIKTKTSDQEKELFRPIFRDDLVNPGTQDKIKPLSPGTTDGAFLMIFSTDAKAVSDTIGSFAENQLAADAITNLVNRDAVQEARAATPDLDLQIGLSTALRAELDRLVGKLQATPPPTQAAANGILLDMLHLIARQVEPSASFADLDQASTWFQGRDFAPRAGGGS